ncbi:hypothetical protein GGQ80_000577 [Sphingomonas jinjuensis]|uniref:Uncharacterized protein n=2 Tax=Sphingomonas jinjuensis TaxID=535907 RepID=A0A840F858_9SPHN|nr:hypothetical protein [Sphingomonas jinjuensis]
MERDALLYTFANPQGGSAVADRLAAANLTSLQRIEVLAAIDAALSEAFYTLLRALDGSASLGGCQQAFKLNGEGGEIIADGDGRLEAAAWETFYGSGG